MGSITLSGGIDGTSCQVWMTYIIVVVRAALRSRFTGEAMAPIALVRSNEEEEGFIRISASVRPFKRRHRCMQPKASPSFEPGDIHAQTHDRRRTGGAR